jgi:GT2 family glycosyltransferase
MSKRKRHARIPKGTKKRPAALVDIIMPVFGEWAMLEKAIQSVEQACLGLEEGYRIIVVDNGTPPWSNDQGQTILPGEQAGGTRDLLRPQDGFFRLEENQGYPGAINLGVSKGSSPLILIWTADVVMQPGSITEVVKVLDDPKVGVAGVKLLFPIDESPHGPPGMVQHAGIAFDIEGSPYHIFIGWRSDHPKVNKQREVAAVTGALLMTRRSLFEGLGGFQTIYGKGTYEDMDYCFACREQDYKVIYCPTAWGYHYVGGSIRHGAGKSGFALHVNATIFKGRWTHMLQWDEWMYW